MPETKCVNFLILYTYYFELKKTEIIRSNVVNRKVKVVVVVGSFY